MAIRVFTCDRNGKADELGNFVAVAIPGKWTVELTGEELTQLSEAVARYRKRGHEHLQAGPPCHPVRLRDQPQTALSQPQPTR